MAVRYITVTPVAKTFSPATRSFGDIAVIGSAPVGATGPINTPIAVTNPDSVADKSNPGGKDKPIDDPAWFQGTGQVSQTRLRSDSGTHDRLRGSVGRRHQRSRRRVRHGRQDERAARDHGEQAARKHPCEQGRD